MKFVLQIIITVILAYVLELFFPWWSIAIAAFLGGVIFNSVSNFGAGFLAIFLLWLFAALIIDNNAAADLAGKVARIFSVSKTLLMLITALLGGLVGGFASMTGSALRKGKRRMKYY